MFLRERQINIEMRRRSIYKNSRQVEVLDPETFEPVDTFDISDPTWIDARYTRLLQLRRITH